MDVSGSEGERNGLPSKLSPASLETGASRSGADNTRDSHQNPADHQEDATRRRRHWRKRDAGETTPREIAAEQRKTEHQNVAAKLRQLRMNSCARHERYQREEYRGVEEQELGCGLNRSATGHMRGRSRKAHPAQACNCAEQTEEIGLEGSSSTPLAQQSLVTDMRRSAIPIPVRLDVVMISGYAAARFAILAAVSASRSSMPPGFNSSAFVSTI